MISSPKIAPSILSADFSEFGKAVRDLEIAGADRIHVDVMDGHFVPNITFGPKLIKDIRRHTTLPLDVHLMIKPVDPYLEVFCDAGSDIVLFHPEASGDVKRALSVVKNKGKQVGLVLNPDVSLDMVVPYISQIDQILIMTVKPGFGGQAFMEDQLVKIEHARHLIEQSGHDITLEVDGGIDPTTAPKAIQAGADLLVAGTSVFKTQEYKNNINALRGD